VAAGHLGEERKPSIVTSGFSLVAFWLVTCSATLSLIIRSA
jgi:hypothetical protein